MLHLSCHGCFKEYLYRVSRIGYEFKLEVGVVGRSKFWIDHWCVDGLLFWRVSNHLHEFDMRSFGNERWC